MKNGCIEFADGDKAWFINGKRHREDGPAIEEANGGKAWFINGKRYSQRDYWKELYKLGKISQEELILELL